MGDIIWEDERKAPRRGKRCLPEDEEPREFPKAIIYAIIALVVIIPAGIILYDTLNIGSQPAYSTGTGAYSERYRAFIVSGESNGTMAATYHDAALINFSRGEYDLAIAQMTQAAGYSLQSMGEYQRAVREMPQDYGGANLSSEGALYMHEAETRYVEAFKCYRSGDAENASRYWDEAKYYVGLSEKYRVSHYY
ncbi:MAG: hypothetical protein A4E28_00346 [Methanocella sp. PtaU1.Bin125]|nr:MAG: hypothetical protein A4E28_00346 [Methanocella sp. PtaU1.Bin125]